MSGLLQKISKLGYDELRVRGMQALNSFSERRGWSSLGKLVDNNDFCLLLSAVANFRTAEEYVAYFRSRTQPAFFLSLQDRERTIAAFRSRWPKAEAQTVGDAERILSGEFDLLGYSGLKFGDPINWQLEPLSGKSAPLVHWSRLDYLNAETVGDKKIIWELNRHQYLVKLGQAYLFTSNEDYARAFVSYLTSWMDQNPPKKGINWVSSLEIAFRSIAWLWALQFFRDSPSLSAETTLRAIKFLYLNARHLETYLSTYFSPNTHLTGEALGLFYLGTLLPEFSEASRWKETGKQILLTQLPKHVRPDGVYVEQSSYYHRYTTDFYTHFVILSQLNGDRVSPDITNALRALLNHLMFVTRPDGFTSFWGDDDGGRLLKFDRRPANDFRAALATGAVLFGRGEYKFVAREVAEESLWLLGEDRLREFDALEAKEPEQQSAAFPDGGYYAMRDGWGRDANYLLFDCGPHGMLNCGHAHADALSFELAANGSTTLVDPGTFTYTGSKELRDWFRSSMAHNTLTVDGESSSVCLGPFSWKSIADCQTSKWVTHRRFDLVQGSHNGYLRLPDPVEHSRSILFLKKDYWIIRDELKSQGEHRADLWFHFSAEAEPVIEATDPDSTVVVTRDERGELSVAVFTKSGRWGREDASVSSRYGERVPSRVYVYSTSLRGNGEILTFLLPRRSTVSTPLRVREVEAIGGKAFEISHENGSDVVMIRHGEGQRVEMERLSSDFEWTWARFSAADESTPSELVVLDGTSLDLEGRKILRSDDRLEYLVAKRSGEGFQVQTPGRDFDCLLTIAGFAAVNSDLKSIQ